MSASLARTPRPRMLRHPTGVVAIVILVVLALIAALAPVLAPHDPLSQSVMQANLAPSGEHWFGTDQFGRDVFSRVLYGTRSSLVLGTISPVLAALVGCALGVIAGYFGGRPDRLISRLIDLLMCFPELLLGIMVAAALGPGFWELVAALALAFVPRFARIARASTLQVRREPFIEASIAVGCSHSLIIFRHVLPNIAGPIVVVLTLWVATAIRLEATLSFLGLGTQPPQPSWGNIIHDGLNNLFGSPWPIIAAGAAITLTVLTFNLLGDAVRDLLDVEREE